MSHKYHYETLGQDENVHSSNQVEENLRPEEKRLSRDSTSSCHHSRMSFIIGTCLVILSFISGSILHPLSLSVLDIFSSNRHPSQDQDSPRAYVPSCKQTPIFK
jgi:hypothetical protein